MRPRFGKAASAISDAVSTSSSGGASSRARKTGSLKNCASPSPLQERQVAVAEVAVAPAEGQRVERDDDRAVARRRPPGRRGCRRARGRPTSRAGTSAARRRARRRRPRARSRRRSRGSSARRSRATARATPSSASGCSDREHADRREQERHRRAQAEHLDREVALGVAGQHPRPQPPPLERLAGSRASSPPSRRRRRCSRTAPARALARRAPPNPRARRATRRRRRGRSRSEPGFRARNTVRDSTL